MDIVVSREATRMRRRAVRQGLPFPPVIGEFERPVRRRAAQDRALRRYLTRTVAPYSPRYGDVLRSHEVAGVASLEHLPLTTLADERDVNRLVLQPTAERIAASRDRALQARLWLARATRRLTAFNRHEIEPRFKPVHWQLTDAGAASLPLGYTARDLDQLAEVGRSMLEQAGIAANDVLVVLQPETPDLVFWQLALGSRRAGVARLFAGTGDAPQLVAQLGPNVVAGRAGDLARLLEDGRGEGYSFAGLHTLLVLGEPLDPVVRARLSELAGTAGRPVTVVAAWAPPGVRAVWSECRDGTDVHTWPAVEVLEVVDPLSGAPLPPGTDGEIVHTPLGWHGTVLLRLRTGVYGCVDDTPCVSCGRTSPRVRLVPFLPPFARILDEHPDVSSWQAELRTVDGAEELIVFLATTRRGHPGPLVRELDRQLSATQFVVLDRRSLAARLRASGDQRVVDLRA